MKTEDKSANKVSERKADYTAPVDKKQEEVGSNEKVRKDEYEPEAGLDIESIIMG